jgi:hypothetical protein
MASFEDAALGWIVYRDRGGDVSRAQINQALRSRGRKSISKRTYAHYGKLMRLGYFEYVSINRLDLRHSNESIFDVADRSRYFDRGLSSPGRLVLPTASGIDSISGQIGTVSEGFATLRTARTAEAVSATRAIKWDRGVLVFEQVGVERAVKVVEGIERGEQLDLLLEFRSLLETDLVFGDSPYPVIQLRFGLDLGPDASLYRVLGAVHTTFDLFESVRGFVDLTASGGRDDAPTLPTLRVRRLEFSNPLEAVLSVGVAVAVAATFVLNRVSRSVENVADATAKVQNLRREDAAERRREERHRLEVQSLQLDNLKKAIEVSSLVEEVTPVLEEVAGVQIPEIEPSRRFRLEALKDQAVEAATELQLETSEPIVLEEVEHDERA